MNTILQQQKQQPQQQQQRFMSARFKTNSSSTTTATPLPESTAPFHMVGIDTTFKNTDTNNRHYYVSTPTTTASKAISSPVLHPVAYSRSKTQHRYFCLYITSSTSYLAEGDLALSFPLRPVASLQHQLLARSRPQLRVHLGRVVQN